jgi:hypothetical protein
VSWLSLTEMFWPPALTTSIPGPGRLVEEPPDEIERTL